MHALRSLVLNTDSLRCTALLRGLSKLQCLEHAEFQVFTTSGTTQPIMKSLLVDMKRKKFTIQTSATSVKAVRSVS